MGDDTPFGHVVETELQRKSKHSNCHKHGNSPVADAFLAWCARGLFSNRHGLLACWFICRQSQYSPEFILQRRK